MTSADTQISVAAIRTEPPFDIDTGVNIMISAILARLQYRNPLQFPLDSHFVKKVAVEELGEGKHEKGLCSSNIPQYELDTPRHFARMKQYSSELLYRGLSLAWRHIRPISKKKVLLDFAVEAHDGPVACVFVLASPYSHSSNRPNFPAKTFVASTFVKLSVLATF